MLCYEYLVDSYALFIHMFHGCITGKRKTGTLPWEWYWWRHQMETFFVLLALCEGNPSVTGGFPSQRPVTRSVDVFFDLRPCKRLSKQSRRQWFENASRLLWRFCDVWKLLLNPFSTKARTTYTFIENYCIFMVRVHTEWYMSIIKILI